MLDENEYEDIAEMFTDKYLKDSPHARAAQIQIREMLAHKNTNNAKLSQALMHVGEKCKGDQFLLLKCLANFYVEFNKRNNYFVIDINL